MMQEYEKDVLIVQCKYTSSLSDLSFLVGFSQLMDIKSGTAGKKIDPVFEGLGIRDSFARSFCLASLLRTKFM